MTGCEWLVRASPRSKSPRSRTPRDELLQRPEVDPNRVAMVGLSYGGYYAQMTPAIDKRIKVSVSSCYFEEFRKDATSWNELSVPTDFRFMNRMTLLNDADLIALICPRAHQIQAGSRDKPSHREKGKSLAPRSAVFYEKLGLDDRFQHMVFDGGHEFNDASAWSFVRETPVLAANITTDTEQQNDHRLDKLDNESTDALRWLVIVDRIVFWRTAADSSRAANYRGLRRPHD